MKLTVPVLAVGGASLATLVVVAGGKSGTATTTPPTSWLGLLSATGYRPGGPWLTGAVGAAGLILLVLLWVYAMNVVAHGAVSERAAWRLALAWATPFIVGPPLVSKDIYAYAANGVMLQNGLDPYRSGVSALNGLHTAAAARALAAVDPTWQRTPSPYGPLSSVIERTAAQIAGGNPVVTVVVLRVVAVLGVGALVWLSASLATRNRALVVVGIGLNPLVLVHAVSGGHIEAVMAALLVAGLVAARSRRWILAVVLVCAAGAVKAPVYAALLPMLVVHARQRTTSRWRPILLDLLVAALSTAVFVLLVPNGLGWLHNLSTPTKGTSPRSIPVGIYSALHQVLPAAWSDAVTTLVTLAALAAAAGVVVWLAVTSERRPLEASVGLGLVALAALAPVFYPWYLLWGLGCLLPVATPQVRDWLVALCAVITLTALNGLPSWLALIIDIIAAVVGAWWLYHRHVVRAGVAAGDAQSRCPDRERTGTAQPIE
ncbi:MAG: polyprenol phosphomannose-dependent alpha 1,6 mannosyltransferase MptB [Jatrophihabitans sp.]